MRTILLLLLITASCRDVDRGIASQPTSTKPVERTTPDDHEYVQVRSSFEQRSRDRLAKLDERIAELEKSAAASAHETVLELRHDRQELADRLDQIRVQAKPQWDDFQSHVENGFQQLEQRVDEALR